ncbi:MAG: ASCH domain-containing protein [Thermoplasmata archaeon]
MVDIILSIKPEYAEKILIGFKRFEFRKQIPRRQIHIVYIYSSYPEKMIVGKFRIRRIIKGTPDEIWERCGANGGIEKERFFSYFGGRSTGYGFEIDQVERFDPPIDPKKKNGEFKAPQSFAYIQDVGELGLEAP